LYINESFQQQAECVPGMQALIGSFHLTIEAQRQDYDLVLSVAPIDLLQVAAATEHHKHPLTLAEAGLSKRQLALWLSGLVALFFLLMPLAQSLTYTQVKWREFLHFSLLESWNLGQMSHGHRSISAKCGNCHQQPFTAVADAACKNCHAATHQHIQDQVLHDKAFKDMRCATCHPDHRGEEPMTRLDGQCVSCHGDIKAKNSKSIHANIHDFSVDHPSFKLTLRTGEEEKDVIRVPQENKRPEKSGLKFSHKVHLDKAGVSSPEGDTVMICQDCHLVDEAGARFKPISMGKSCQQSGCHALEFNPPVPERALPHGSERKLMATLNEYYAKAAIDELLTGKTRRCGEVPTTGNNLLERALSCANNKVIINTNSLFKGKEGCVECHEVSADLEDKEIPWKVKSVHLTRHWLRNAHFPHNKHSTAKCTDCHDKLESKKSADVSIPDITKCRQCHVGKKLVKGKVSSSCEDCHIFHAEKNAPSEDTPHK
jgi:hypothetical protein